MVAYKVSTRAVALCLLTACGPAALPPSAAPGDQASQAADAAASAKSTTAIASSQLDDGALDLTPAAVPGHQVVHLRWNNPAATISTLAGFTTISSNVVEAALQTGAQTFIRDALGGDVDVQALAQLVRLDSHVEMAMVVVKTSGGEPEPMAAISLGLASLERARATSKLRARKLSPGVWRLGSEREFGTQCLVAAASGPTPARLICAESQQEALTLAPYLATNLATQRGGRDDVRLRVTLRAMLDHFDGDIDKALDELRGVAPALASELPSFKARADAIVKGLADELLAVSREAGSIELTLTADAQKGLSAGAQINFVGKRSWTVKSMLDGADLTAVAPDLFWSLPASSQSASYATTVDPVRYRELLSVMRDGIAAIMKREGWLTAGDRAALAALVRLPVSKHIPVVSASGRFPQSGGAQGVQALLDDGLGWYLYGVDDSPTKLRKYINDVVRAYNRPTIQRVAKNVLGKDSKLMPRIRSVRAPATLGPGAMAVELVLPNLDDLLPTDGALKKSGQPTPSKLYVMLTSKGGRSWIGYAAQRAPLTQLMAGLQRGTLDKLSSRSDLTVLRNQPHNAGSFFQLTGVTDVLKTIVEADLAGAAGSQKQLTQRIMAAFNNMPNKGQTPIISVLDIDAGAHPGATVKLRVPAESLRDVGFLASESISALEDANP